MRIKRSRLLENEEIAAEVAGRQIKKLSDETIASLKDEYISILESGKKATVAHTAERLIAALAAHQLFSEEDIALVITETADVIKTSVAEKKYVTIRGFGKFFGKQKKGHSGTIGGREFEIKTKTNPIFKADKSFQELVSKANPILQSSKEAMEDKQWKMPELEGSIADEIAKKEGVF